MGGWGGVGYCFIIIVCMYECSVRARTGINPLCTIYVSDHVRARAARLVAFDTGYNDSVLSYLRAGATADYQEHDLEGVLRHSQTSENKHACMFVRYYRSC